MALVQTGTLERKLQNRHIQMIALGGAIGTGLFLGSAGVIESAGPGILLGYLIGGVLIFIIMRFLGEMLVDEPRAGSFSYFANRYVSRFAGFLAGWNCLALYILVGMVELTAVGRFVHFWWPDVPVWLTAAVFLVVINGVNFINVKVYGEFEFWFALIKVVAVIAMILMGIYLLVSTHNPSQSVSNIWSHGGFLPNGFQGVLMAFPFVLFAFGGVEMLGFAASETENPQVVIPKAINQLVVRILLFYIASSAVLLSLIPWNDLVAQLTAGGDTYSSSPFVLVFSSLGENVAAHLLNFVILTATLSVYNSMVYASSRLLYGMAQQGNAPKSLTKVNSQGVPVRAIVYPGMVTALCVVLNYVAPSKVMEALMSLIVASLVVTWFIIILAHWNYRKKRVAEGKVSNFKAPLFPLTTVVCLVAMAVLLCVMYLTPDIRASVYAIPIWIAVVYMAYRVFPLGRANLSDTATSM